MLDRVIHVVPQGGPGNRMIQYMAALRLQELVPGARISNVHLPEWGIDLPEIVHRPADLVLDQERLDLRRAVAMLCMDISRRVDITSYAQDVSNFLDPGYYQSIFPQLADAPPAVPDDVLLCNIRGAEVLDARHPDYVQIPPLFYAEMAQATGLRPIFMGQLANNAYLASLRSALPQADFLPSQGLMADFQMLRTARFIVPAISTFSWLGAWLSSAEKIFLPVNGLFHPRQHARTDFLPLADPRYRYFLFPVNYAVQPDRMAETHRALDRRWRALNATDLGKLRRPCPIKREFKAYMSAFNEAEYFSLYPDVAQAVAKGDLPSGHEHFVLHGFEEHRQPMRLDRAWYAMICPQAAFLVSEGIYADLEHHYCMEGRLSGVPARRPA